MTRAKAGAKRGQRNCQLWDNLEDDLFTSRNTRDDPSPVIGYTVLAFSGSGSLEISYVEWWRWRRRRVVQLTSDSITPLVTP